MNFNWNLKTCTQIFQLMCTHRILFQFVCMLKKPCALGRHIFTYKCIARNIINKDQLLCTLLRVEYWVSQLSYMSVCPLNKYMQKPWGVKESKWFLSRAWNCTYTYYLLQYSFNFRLLKLIKNRTKNIFRLKNNLPILIVICPSIVLIATVRCYYMFAQPKLV